MTKVHLVDSTKVFGVRMEMDAANVIPIRPLRSVLLQMLGVPTSEEWPVPRPPGASLSFALDPDEAIQLALALYQAATSVQKSP